MKKLKGVCQIRMAALSIKRSSKGFFEEIESSCFFVILKCFFKNDELSFEKISTIKGVNFR